MSRLCCILQSYSVSQTGRKPLSPYDYSSRQEGLCNITHIPLMLGSIASQILSDSPPFALHLCPFKTASPFVDCVNLSHMLNMVQWYCTRFQHPGTLAFDSLRFQVAVDCNLKFYISAAKNPPTARKRKDCFIFLVYLGTW
jgi:hypothetical protein